jgi:NAD(P)-dependent dehydrogenase (short-subunit alcohol dehydrogenase family)
MGMPDESVEQQEGRGIGKPIGAAENTARTFTRRKILATSAAAVVGAAALGLRRVSGEESSVSDTAPKTNFSLNGKSAIVTGAARGIGRAIAVALASAGADIMGVDIAGLVSPEVIYPAAYAEELNETGRLVEAEKRRFVAVTADTRDIDALCAAADQANKEFGKIDIVVANAGIQIYSPLSKMTDQQWKDVIDVNLTGSANTLRAVIPYMIPRKSGRIILVSSGQGRHGMKDGSAYSASKWGIIGLMKSVALELGEYQITVNTLEPGLVDTPMTRNPGRWIEALKEAGKQPEGENPREQDVIAARLPTSVMKIPWMQPADVAPVAVFLASDAAYRITGATYDATAGDSAKYTA